MLPSEVAPAFQAAADKAAFLEGLSKGQLIQIARSLRIHETVATGPDISRNRRTKRSDELKRDILEKSGS
jgi:hypothetical protein